jgi:hypothetical protein
VNQRINKPTYLYVMGEPGSFTVKIGMTTDLEARCSQIQRMSPVKIEVLWAVPSPYALERALHRHFAEQRSHGEWFEFSSDPLPLIQAALDDGLLEAVAACTPTIEEAAPTPEPDMSIRARLMLKELRRYYAGVWFSLGGTADHIGFDYTSMRAGLAELTDLGKVTRGPERLHWMNQQYALVAGSRA